MSCSAPATAMAATALAFSSLSLKTSHPCCTFFRPKNPKPQSGAGFRIGKMPGGVSFCSKDTETTFFESENPDAEQTEFNPPTPPEGYVPPTPFYEFPEETEEELGAAYEEIYGPAYSGESFLGKDVYVMDDKVKKKTGLGLRRRNVKVKDGFDERVVQVRRVTKVVKGGKQLHFRAVVVVGDKQGQVGVGVGKAKEVISAVEKSALNARRNIVSVPLTKYSTFPHRADGDYGAAKVMLRPASPGTGVIAGGAVRIVLEMAGVENALGKQIRSKNALNLNPDPRRRNLPLNKSQLRRVSPFPPMATDNHLGMRHGPLPSRIRGSLLRCDLPSAFLPPLHVHLNTHNHRVHHLRVHSHRQRWRRAVLNRGYDEYRLQDYSGWLKDRVRDPGYWTKVRDCLRDAKVCKHMEMYLQNQITGEIVPEPADTFYQRKLSPIESGCCKPPASCGFVYVNETFWNPIGGATAVNTDGDCAKWSNDQQLLCFDCDSCKASVLSRIKKSWRSASVVTIVVLVIMVVVYVVACAAFRNNRRSTNNEPYRMGGMTKSTPSTFNF